MSWRTWGLPMAMEVQTCLEAGITPYVPRPLTAAHETLGLLQQEMISGMTQGHGDRPMSGRRAAHVSL